jgi:hypothetical protein
MLSLHPKAPAAAAPLQSMGYEQPTSTPERPILDPPRAPKVRWRRLLAKTVTVVVTEVVLNAVGLDAIANYAEFLNDHSAVATAVDAFSNLITLV